MKRIAQGKDFKDTTVSFKPTKDFLGNELIQVTFSSGTIVTMTQRRFDELFVELCNREECPEGCQYKDTCENEDDWIDYSGCDPNSSVTVPQINYNK